MAYATLIARACDGLVLAETRDERGHVPFPTMQQATQLLARLHAMSPRCSLEVGGNIFHLLICDGVCYLGIFDYRYPKVLAFTFLEEVRELFREELKQSFGTGSVDHRSHIETIEKPYYFVRFDRQILKKQADFQDPSSSKAVSRLNGSSVQVSNGLGHIGSVLHTAQSCHGATGKASDAQAAPKKLVNGTAIMCLALAIVVLMLVTIGAVVQVHPHCVIGLGCLAVVLGLYCLIQCQGRGGGKSLKPSAASDCFSCVSDYMI
mmetsp:Transcript_59560/g.159594  ORF Transcript_59560/g.159594 Transcript_59560/m.159594 type:complete len:263 (-) Transcript_59560:93-881(-)